jgi:hypothetical protein
MFLHVKISKEEKDKKSKTYLCARCGAVITHSAANVRINGATDHSFVNPVGIQCIFLTFIDCDNVDVHEDLFLEHSWFPAYGWRFLTCGNCAQHLGWKYDALQKKARPRGFFGVLKQAVEEVPEEPEPTKET